MRFEFYMRLTYMQYDAVKPFKKLKMFFFFVGNDIWNDLDLFFLVFFFFYIFPLNECMHTRFSPVHIALSMILY